MKVFVVQKIKKAKKLPLNEWSLGNFIDDSSDLGLLDLEVKKSVLRLGSLEIIFININKCQTS